MADLGKDILKGGKLIGEGSSTCVFKPNLPCKNKKIDISDKRIAKLFLKKPDDLLKELKTNKKISKLPKSKEWSVVLDDMCEAADYNTLKNVEPDIDKCLKNNVQNPKHLIPEDVKIDWVRGGIPSRQLVRDIEYKERCQE